MGLFENYKVNARAELERDLRKLEEKGQPQNEEERQQFLNCGANVEFAQRIQLINQQQARELMRRLQEAQVTARVKELYRTEYESRTDSFENPRERAERYQTMDSINAEIQKERAQASADRSNQQNVTHTQSYSDDTESRTR